MPALSPDPDINAVSPRHDFPQRPRSYWSKRRLLLADVADGTSTVTLLPLRITASLAVLPTPIWSAHR